MSVKRVKSTHDDKPFTDAVKRMVEENGFVHFDKFTSGDLWNITLYWTRVASDEKDNILAKMLGQLEEREMKKLLVAPIRKAKPWIADKVIQFEYARDMMNRCESDALKAIKVLEKHETLTDDTRGDLLCAMDDMIASAKRARMVMEED